VADPLGRVTPNASGVTSEPARHRLASDGPMSKVLPGECPITGCTGCPPTWESSNCRVDFDIPGGGSARIYIPASDEQTALATFHAKWPTIAEAAIARHQRADHIGDLVLVIGMFAWSTLAAASL
jgi:hypothetical protein